MRTLFLLFMFAQTCNYCGMAHGIKLFLIFTVCYIAGYSCAHAARLDVSHISQSGEFSASFGAAFKTGANRDNTTQTDFLSGRVHELSLDLDYTFLDDWTISFSTDNDYSDSQIGVKWKLIKFHELKIDFMADYGIAWTKNAKTDVRLGNNNFDFGMRVHGIALQDFQWAVKIMGQFVFAEPKNFWNINLTAEAMYYFHPDIAAKFEFEYDFNQISAPITQYDRTIHFGIIYNMSNIASVHPYVKYHFKTDTADNNYIPDNFWKIGAEFSVEF